MKPLSLKRKDGLSRKAEAARVRSLSPRSPGHAKRTFKKYLKTIKKIKP